jgi:hypothetical protein
MGEEVSIRARAEESEQAMRLRLAGNALILSVTVFL